MAFGKSKLGETLKAKNKPVLNKTKIFRDCFSEEDIKELAKAIKEIAFNDELSPTDRKAYIDIILKYNIMDVATEVKSDVAAQEAEDERINSDKMKELIAALSNELIK